MFHCKKKWARYDRKCILDCTYSSLYSCPILMELEFSRQIFEKYSVLNFMNPSSGSRVVACWQTEGRTDMTKLIIAFRNFANAPKSDCRFLVNLFCIISSMWPNMSVNISVILFSVRYTVWIFRDGYGFLITLFYIWICLQFMITLFHDVQLKQIYISHEPPV
jgi:hypothetical protein